MNNNRVIELEKIISRLEKRTEKTDRQIKKIAYYRLIVFIFGLFAVFLAFFYLNTFYTSAAIIVSVAIQIALSYPHNKLLNSIQSFKIYKEIKQSYIDRINLNWGKIPFKSQNITEKYNPVGIDLNISGVQSLHQLIDLTNSEEGRRILELWLTNLNPEHKDINIRQTLIKELIPLNRFRDKLLLNTRIITKRDINIKGLLNWLNIPSNNVRLNKYLIILSIIAPVNLLLILLYYMGAIPAFWPVSTCVYLAIYFLNQRLVKDTFDNALFLKDELGKLSRLLYFLEKYNYQNSPALKELCSPFIDKNRAPSFELKIIKRLISVLQLQKNPFIWFIFILLVPADYLYAHKLEKVKQDISDALPEWLDRWSRLEALVSLATFAYLNPEYTFPSILAKNEPEFDDYFFAERLGHPLLPKSQKVCNDFKWGKTEEVAIITGSNMSGKSTFLRALGINVLLAYSGGPVNADKFTLPLLRLYTCIKVSDSVVDGISYFYAEVKRLKLLLEQLEQNNNKPVLFLIDEIFKGTNNVERLIGSRSYIKAVLGKNGFGCISTHDLELVKLADEFKGISNYHFREEVINNKMLFDYILRNGPCPTTNALRIMKIEGLPVDNI